MKYAEVELPLPIKGPFTYQIPDNISKVLTPGVRVKVSLRNRDLIGYVVGLSNHTSYKNLKSIKEVIDQQPLVSEELLKLARWIADYYQASWGEALETVLPSAVRKPIKRRKKKDVVEGKSAALLPHLELNPDQSISMKALLAKLRSRTFGTFLLHGITGSGKTEMYLQAIAENLTLGRTSIVLVPEIALTSQLTQQFIERFGDTVALWHSHLTDAERAHTWRQIKQGGKKIIVGARSAIFAPVADLGLIVIDEEHDGSYKQDSAPRYHAREVAIMRAKLSSSMVILGSATPSLESFYLAQAGNYHYLRLEERIDDRALPKVEIVDMRNEKFINKLPPVFSRRLRQEIENMLSRKEQAIIFLNRRGFFTHLYCKQCGHVEACPKCNISLTFHSESKELHCHTCGFSKKETSVCPHCKAGYLNFVGAGTERVESELARLFPQARIARLDTDVTRKRHAHEIILGKFRKKEIDILVGTQMVAKGHDFPQVTLVGVVSADSALHIPNFRSCEQTFQLLTQVAGRAGRSDLGGRVIIQTRNPEHYAITNSIKHDYINFYKEEIEFRRELNFPPYSHLVKLEISCRKEEDAEAACRKLARSLKRRKKPGTLEIFGPAKDLFYKKRSRYYWSIMLKAADVFTINHFLIASLAKFKKKRTVRLAIDVDPL